jgi:glycosyltransferase involved in cell wall biosynthesis
MDAYAHSAIGLQLHRKCIVDLGGMRIIDGKRLHLRHRHEAWITERGDAEELADAILALRADPALSEAIGRRGRAFALAELRWERAAATVVEFYRDCLVRHDNLGRRG